MAAIEAAIEPLASSCDRSVGRAPTRARSPACRHRNYRLFFTGQVISVSGTWMQNVALAWLVVELTALAAGRRPARVLRFIPFTVFGLFAGVVADRIDNRKLVITTQAVSMTFAALLAVLVLGGGDARARRARRPLEHRTRLRRAGRHALTFQMVGRAELPNAVALSASLFNVVGPAIAGVLIAALSASASASRSTRSRSSRCWHPSC